MGVRRSDSPANLNINSQQGKVMGEARRMGPIIHMGSGTIRKVKALGKRGPEGHSCERQGGGGGSRT